MLRDLAVCIKCMHEKGIIHGDCKKIQYIYADCFFASFVYTGIFQSYFFLK